MKATCYNKNTPIFTCVVEGGSISALHEVLDTDHLPIVLQDNMNLKSVNKWLSQRKIPEKREGLKEARSIFPGFEAYNHMFSLSDQYWFQYKRTETWEKLNYFTNPYSEEIGRIFFEPWTVEKTEENPDLTTNGVCRKRWIKREGVSKLIKAGSKRYHQEPISEVLSSITLEQMDIIPFVKYSLIIDGLSICCICDNFIDENTEYVPFDHIYNKTERNKDKETVYEHTIKMAKAYGISNAEDYIERMIVADHFMCNTDRHLGNFGLIRNVGTGKIEGFAPLFDCGSAFFSPKAGNAIYPEHEKKFVKKYIPELSKKNMSMDPLIKLTKEYPSLEKKQEKYIIKNIKRVYGELGKSDKEKLEKMKDDDLLFR